MATQSGRDLGEVLTTSSRTWNASFGPTSAWRRQAYSNRSPRSPAGRPGGRRWASGAAGNAAGFAQRRGQTVGADAALGGPSPGRDRHRSRLGSCRDRRHQKAARTPGHSRRHTTRGAGTMAHRTTGIRQEIERERRDFAANGRARGPDAHRRRLAGTGTPSPGCCIQRGLWWSARRGLRPATREPCQPRRGGATARPGSTRWLPPADMPVCLVRWERLSP